MEELVKKYVPQLYASSPLAINHVYIRYDIDGHTTMIQYVWSATCWVAATVELKNKCPIAIHIDGATYPYQQCVYLTTNGKNLVKAPGTYAGCPPIIAVAGSLVPTIPVLIYGNDITIRPDPGWTDAEGPYIRNGSIEGDPTIAEGMPPMLCGKQKENADIYLFILILVIIAAIAAAGYSMFQINAHSVKKNDAQAAVIMSSTK